MPPAPQWFSWVAWGSAGIVAGIVGFTAVAGLTTSLLAAAIAGGGLGAIVTAALFRSSGGNAALTGVPPAIRVLFAVGAPLLVAELLFAAAFIMNPHVTRWNASPLTPQRSNHSCVSSYWVACESVRTAPDIYDEVIYSVPTADPTAARVARPIGPLLIDQYEYPPPFLVLPRLLAAATGDFWSFRRLWFALNLAVIVAGLVLVGARLDRTAGTHATWLTPFVLVPPAMIVTIIMGNIQLAVIAAALIAMVLFERGRHVAGGALLAYTIVSKLFPGLLIFYLLLRRDWRPVAWTTAFAAAIVIISIADVGLGPYVAFATHMPKLLSGEAFPAFRNPAAIAINESVPGLVFKLHLFGVPAMGFTAAKAVGWIYTAVAVGVVARLALRPSAPDREPLAWLVILIVATMRSPFLPTYAPFPSLWLATLLAALTWGRSGIFVTAVAAWVVLSFTFGTGAVPPRLNAIWTFVHTVAAFVIVVMAIRVATAPREHGAVARPLAGVGQIA